MKWFTIESAENLRAFSIIIGGRGIGKTYGTIDFLVRENKPFLYLRNTEVQIKESATDFGNPFKRYNRDKGTNYRMVSEGNHYLIVTGESKENRKTIGYAASLSTFKNLRGVDLSDIAYIFFDEFIERDRLMYNQYQAFVNCYETINRNREIIGEEPVKTIMLSNAQRLGNDILAGLNLIPVIEGMIKRGETKRTTKDYIIMLPRVDISEHKADTALYRMIKNSDMARENLKNEFARDSFFGIGARNLQEFKPLVSIDGLYIYKHKSDGTMYCSRISADVPKFTTKDNRALFMRAAGIVMREYYARGKLTYCDYTAKMIIDRILMVD